VNEFRKPILLGCSLQEPQIPQTPKLFFEHKIPLGETDAIQPPPALNGGLKVRCDDCGQEYTYQPKDLLRSELELPESFTPQQLFL
jgi:hypothetical protein